MQPLASALALLPLALAVPLGGAPEAPLPVVEFPDGYVAADATLVAHIDLAELRGSMLGQMLLAQRDQIELDELDEIQEELGIDLFEEIHSVTLYGTGKEPEPSAAVLVTSDEVDRLIARLSQEEGFGRVAHGDLELFQLEDAYAWVAKRKGGDRVVVIGESAEGVTQAAQVVRGNAPSLRDRNDAGLDLTPLAGSIVFVSASELGHDLGNEPASQVLGLAQGIRFDIGEAGDSLFLHLALSTGSVDEARDLMSVLQGVLAMARLAGGEGIPPEARQLLDGLQVSARGDRVSIDFEYSLVALAGLMASMED